MEVSWNFEVAVYLAWLCGTALLLALICLRPDAWHAIRPVVTREPRREALIALGLALAVVAISVGTDALLAGWKRGALGDAVRLLQLALVYAPLLLWMGARGEGLDTCFLRLEKLPGKLVMGLLISLAAAAVFLAVRGQAGDYLAYLRTLGRGGPVAMLQTFLEGFGIGFLFYRLGAWLGWRVPAVIVALLFMAAHLPSYTVGRFGLELPVAALMALAHAGIGALVLIGIWRSQDIVVFGVLHWFINAASRFTTSG